MTAASPTTPRGAGRADGAAARVSQPSWRRCSRRRRRRARARGLSADPRRSRGRLVEPHRPARPAAQSEPSTRASAATASSRSSSASTPATRCACASAIARLRACPRVLEQGRSEPHRVRCASSRRSHRRTFATATRSTRPAWTRSPRDTSPATRARLGAAQAAALTALHAYRAWLDARMRALSRRRLRGRPEAVRLVSPPRVAAAVRFQREVADDRPRSSSRATARCEAWEANRDAHEPSPSPAADVRDRRPQFLRVLRAEPRERLIVVHRLARDRRHSAVHRAVSHRRGSEGAGRDVSRRLHESAADVLDRSAGLLLRSRFQPAESELLRRSKRGSRCCRCSATRAYPGTSCSSATPITIRISSGTCTTTASSPKAGRSTAKRC